MVGGDIDGILFLEIFLRMASSSSLFRSSRGLGKSGFLVVVVVDSATVVVDLCRPAVICGVNSISIVDSAEVDTTELVVDPNVVAVVVVLLLLVVVVVDVVKGVVDRVVEATVVVPRTMFWYSFTIPFRLTISLSRKPGVVVEDVSAADDDDVTDDEKFGRFSISVIADFPVVEVETEDDTELEVENSVEDLMGIMVVFL